MINDTAGAAGEAALPTRGLTLRVAQGTLWTLGGQGIAVLAALVATPIVIRLLGPESYGALALINVLIGYLSFADLGMTVASTRFAADASEREGDDSEAAVVWTSLALSLVPALLLAASVALFARPLVVHALKLPVHLQDVTTIGLRIAAAGFVFRVAAGVMNSPQLVRLRMDLNALVTHGATLLQVVLVPVVLFCGGGLTGAVTVVAISALLGALAHTRVSMKLLPALRRPSFDRGLLQPLARFGSGLVISSAAAVLLVGAEKAFLARFASVESLAYYAVACNLASLLGVVPGALANTALPAFSRLQASPDRTELAKLYSRTLRGTLLWIAPTGLLLCVLARSFFTIWAGPDYGVNSTPAFFIAVGGLIFSILAYAPYCLLVSYGRSEIIARIHVMELLPYLPVAALLTWYFGIIGAAAAWSLRLAFDAALFAIFARRIAGFRASLFPTGKASYLAATGFLLVPFLLVLNGAAAAVVATATLGALAAYVVIVWIRVLQQEERALIASLLRKYATGQVRTATTN